MSLCGTPVRVVEWIFNGIIYACPSALCSQWEQPTNLDVPFYLLRELATIPQSSHCKLEIYPVWFEFWAQHIWKFMKLHKSTQKAFRRQFSPMAFFWTWKSDREELGMLNMPRLRAEARANSTETLPSIPRWVSGNHIHMLQWILP